MPKRKVATSTNKHNAPQAPSPVRRSTRVKPMKWIDNEDRTVSSAAAAAVPSSSSASNAAFDSPKRSKTKITRRHPKKKDSKDDTPGTPCGDKVQCLEIVTKSGDISPLKILSKKKPVPSATTASTATSATTNNTKPRSNNTSTTRKRKTTATKVNASSKSSKKQQVSKKKEAPPPPRKKRNTKGNRPPSKARGRPPSAAAAASKRSRRRTSKAEDEEDDDDLNEETNTNDSDSDNDNDSSDDDDDDESTNEEEEDDDDSEEQRRREPLYEVGQKVLARDQDGILYQAIVRRKLFGLHHNRQIQVGMVNSQEEIQSMLDEEVQETWHYFVHYFQWNVNWDRWVSQDDILELDDKNIELSQIILKEHKSLMKEFKQHTRHVDGGAFLNAWQDKLKKILAPQDGSDKSNNKKKVSQASAKKKQQAAAKKKQQALLEKQAQLNSQSLRNRPPIQAQQLVLNYGLKKILVEEWELISQFQMLHSLPAPKHNTIYSVLKSYLKEMKGIEMKIDDGVYKDNDDDKKKKIDDDAAKVEVASATTAESATDKRVADEDKQPLSNSNDDNNGESNNNGDSSDKNNNEGEINHDTQEWIDMVNGICMLFDEALPFRLLYPSERAQLQVLEKSFPDTPNSKLYGCEFLLRLFCQLPALLADTYKKKKKKNDNNNSKDNNHGDNNVAEDDDDDDYDNDNAAEIIKPIIAKVYDFVRYLQTNQSTVFGLNYRKPNHDEIRQQTKIDRKKQRQQQQAATCGAVAPGSSAAAPATAKEFVAA